MRKSPFFVNVLLCGLLGSALLCTVAARAFAPEAILPKLNIPALTALSLLALLLRHYLTPLSPRRYGAGGLWSGATFALLPWVSAYLPLGDALRTGAVGGLVFTVTAWLFAAIERRLADTDASPTAPAICAFGLYLASQGFMGILS